MIYINARFLCQDTTGVQRFATELLKSLSLFRQDIILLVPSLDDILDKNFFNIFNIQQIVGGKGHLWEQMTLPWYLKSKGSPLLINLCNTAPVFYRNKLSVIHDINFIKFPHSYSWKFKVLYKILIPLIINTSKKILTVSEFSKKELSRYYSVNLEQISVIYNAVSNDFKPFYGVGNNASKNYALAVSSPVFHKNFPRMIDAFLKSNVEIDLNIIGSFSNTFNNKITTIKNDPRINFLGRVDDEELIRLYQDAKFFIFPSLYEGFGIPPLEAQACGCPVISSNAASLPEVLGESALYFEPNHVNSIKLAIEAINSDIMLREKLITDGFENLKRFSWNKSAQKLNEIIDQVLAE